MVDNLREIGELIRRYILENDDNALKRVRELIEEAKKNPRLHQLAETIAKRVASKIEKMNKTEIRKKLRKASAHTFLELSINGYSVYVYLPSARIEVALPYSEAEKLFGFPTTLIIAPKEAVYRVFQFEIPIELPKWLSSELLKVLNKVWEVAKSKYRKSKEFELYLLIENFLKQSSA